MIKGISHIGVAVRDIERTIKILSKVLNIPVPSIEDNIENKVKVAMIELNGVGIEVLEGYGETGMLVDYVRKNGNGIHHICFLTDSIEGDMEALKDSGFAFRQERPSLGVRGKLRAFSVDDALDGMPFELSEP